MDGKKRDSLPKKVFSVAYSINFIIQAGVSIIVPAGLIILLGWLMTNRWGVGKWAMAVAIVLGILIGFYSMFYYIIKAGNSFDPTKISDKDGEQDGGAPGNPSK